jgi:hypothetical protein
VDTVRHAGSQLWTRAVHGDRQDFAFTLELAGDAINFVRAAGPDLAFDVTVLHVVAFRAP